MQLGDLSVHPGGGVVTTGCEARERLIWSWCTTEIQHGGDIYIYIIGQYVMPILITEMGVYHCPLFDENSTYI